MLGRTYDGQNCSAARALEIVGERWSLLIIRDALFAGLTRFSEFQRSLGIAPNMLTRRLSTLVNSGLLERRRYSEHPQRYEYVLTERGHDFRSVILAMHAWGNKHFAPEGASVLVVNARTGAVADPVVVDRTTGHPIVGPEYRFAPGPAAGESTRRRLASSQWGSSQAGAVAAQAAGVRAKGKPGTRP